MIDSRIENVLSPETLGTIEQAKSSFSHAKPFRHVALKNFLSTPFLSHILHEFPNPESTKTLRDAMGHSSRKHVVQNITEIGPTFRDWDKFLSSSAFIKYLEKVSGIPGLIHDPEYHGAGTHNNFDGQGMLTHIDFNLHPSSGYHRRLNLIVYLNDEWEENWGGHLELHKDPWDPDNDWHVSYPPTINNAVLFETNEVSWHGFNTVRLPSDKKCVSRKSLTVYYYTKERPNCEIAPKHSSIFAPRMLPSTIRPNEPITDSQFSELEDMLVRNVKHIRGIYAFNENLLKQIEGYKRKLKQFENHMVLRTVGQAIQKGSAKGISADSKLIGILAATFKPMAPISAIKIHLRVPDFVETNSFYASVNGVIQHLHADKPDAYCIFIHLDIDCTEEIVIGLSCKRLISPNEANGSPDIQRFGAVVNYIEFVS